MAKTLADMEVRLRNDEFFKGHNKRVGELKSRTPHDYDDSHLTESDENIADNSAGPKIGS